MEMTPYDKHGLELKLGSKIQYKSSRYGMVTAEIRKLSLEKHWVYSPRTKKGEYQDVIKLRVIAEANEAYLKTAKRRYFGGASIKHYTVTLTDFKNIELV